MSGDRGMAEAAALERWHELELGIVGGAAHSLNSALTGLTLAAEMARMDDSPSTLLDVVDQQSERLQREVELLYSLLALERSAIQLHNPLEIARGAARLFERLPAAMHANVRVVASPGAGAVEVDAGPCIRAAILCVSAFVDERQSRDLELEVLGADGGTALRVGCPDSDAVPATDLIDTAAALLAGSGATLELVAGRACLTMRAPHT